MYINGDKNMRSFMSVILLTILLALFAIFIYMDDKDEAAIADKVVDEDFKPKVNYTSPSSSLPDLNDQAVTFGGKQEKLQLVNFWASWCGPCILEAPDLVKLHKNYGDVMTIYAVNSTRYDKEREARAFVDQFGFSFDVLFDREGVFTELYKVNTYPTSFIIDSEGVIRERINGVITYEQWERIIEKWS